MAKKYPDYDWRRVDDIWEEGEVRAPTLKREEPKRTKRRMKYRAPEIPIVEELANREFSVTIGPPVTTPAKEEYPVVIYGQMTQEMHPLNEEMQARQNNVEERAMRQARRQAAAREAEIEEELENQRLARLANIRQVNMIPVTIMGLMRAYWMWIIMVMLVLLVAILSYIIGKDRLQNNKKQQITNYCRQIK